MLNKEQKDEDPIAIGCDARDDARPYRTLV
jgi:hypothetical protein